MACGDRSWKTEFIAIVRPLLCPPSWLPKMPGWQQAWNPAWEKPCGGVVTSSPGTYSCTTGSTENSTDRRQMTEKGRGGWKWSSFLLKCLFSRWYRDGSQMCSRTKHQRECQYSKHTITRLQASLTPKSPMMLPWSGPCKGNPFSMISESSLIQLWNQSCARSFIPLLLETKLLLSSCECNMQFSCLFKNKTELKSNNCFFSFKRKLCKNI